MNTFDKYMEQFGKMTKKQIVDEMIARDFKSPTSREYLMKNYSKTILLRDLADRAARMENRGY